MKNNQVRRFENYMDWAISSRALNRGRFNDYPFVDEISTIGVGLLLEVGENPLNRSTGLRKMRMMI